MSKERDLISSSHYAEFPDVLVTLQLCRAQASLDGRSAIKSLRECAVTLSHRVMNTHLRNTLLRMSQSSFPEVEINRIRACIGKMESRLRREFRDVKAVGERVG